MVDRARLLGELRGGTGVEGACRAAKTTLAALANEAAADDDFAVEIEAAQAEGGSKRQAQTEPKRAKPAARVVEPDDAAPDWDRFRRESEGLGAGL
jgi:hypothetical protein